MSSDPAQSELAKFGAFVDEGRRVWSVNPALVLSREFYLLWEEAHQPRPFVVDGDVLMSGDLCVEVGTDGKRIGHFTWDDEEMCPCLLVEGEAMEQRFLFLFQDGEMLVEETPPDIRETGELTHGERLEVMYDVVAYTREHMPSVDVRRIRGQAYSDALDGVAPWHDPHVIRLMRRLPSEFRQRLVDRVVAEMPDDELSNQLVLPLDGTYAGVAASASPVSSAPERLCRPAGSAPVVFEGTRLTVAAIRRNLALLQYSCLSVTECMSEFALSFEGCDVLSEVEGVGLALRIPARADMPIREGDLMRVVRREGGTQVGELSVDIFDADLVYGRLVWENPDFTYPLDADLAALPSKGPESYVAEYISSLRNVLDQGDMAFTSGLKVGLGMAALPLTVPDRPSPPELDASQRRAWLACTCSDNPLVMVQGPPGTGKTAVLERVVRKLCTEGRSILITAPSNTAVDNVCRRILDLPVLRVSYSRQAVAPDVAAECWADDAEVVARFADKQARTGSCIFAGTHIGILRTPIVGEYLERHGDFDAVVFDEAGMGRAAELFLCMARGRRAILFGDHQQLPPHPLVTEVTDRLRREYGPLTRSEWALVQGSAMQWLGDIRGMPMFLMQRCYRCHNPRLMRFASTLFYDARVRASETAEYYRLPYADRVVKYPSSTLTFFSTSSLPADTRAEKLLVTGNRPGIENPLEARLCVAACIEFLKRYPASEIIIIAPYRMQTGLIRKLLREHPAVKAALDDDAGRLKTFVSTRVSTVDSFQGGESDAVIISYVRSGGTPGIGFVDDPNRVNVAHTRARREMVVVGDLEYLKKHARSDLFLRMERAFRRDGRIVSVTPETLREFGIAPEF